MSDNVAITAGTGTTVATDDVGGAHYQEMKLVDGTKDSSTPIAVDVGVKANALRVAPANDITDATYIGDIKFGEAEPNSAAILADTTAILADTAAIQTAVELLDNAVYVDDADWTDNTSSHLLVGGIYQSTDHTVTDGDVSPFQVDVNGCIVLGTGAKAIGKLAANTGVDIGDVDVTSIVPGTAASNLGKAEDATHASGDVGVMALAVRDDAPSAATAAEGDYTPLLTNGTGQLYTIDPTGNALMTTGNASLATIAGDTTSLDGKVTACNTGAVVLSSGTVTTVSTVTNLSQLGGTAISMNEGVLDAGVQRVTLATDDNAVAHLATIAGDTTAIETAVQIIDDWDAVHDSAASSDGPQLMAAYDATKPTAVADGDAVRVLADEYGRLLSGVEKTAWQEDYDSSDATGEGQVVKASAASTIVVVQSYIISSDVEGWIKLQDEDSTALTGKFWLKAGGGVAITLPENAPLILGVDKDLEVICEAAGDVSVSATGYTIPG